MGRPYHPSASPSASSLPGEKEDAYLAAFRSKPLRQAAVNPDACLIKVRLSLLICGSSGLLIPPNVRSVQGRHDHCFGSINFIPDASSGFFFRGVVFTVIKTSKVGFAFSSNA